MPPHERDFTNLVNELGRLVMAEELFTFVLEPEVEATNNGMSGINEVYHLDAPRKVYTDPRTGQELRPKALGGPELPADKDHDPRLALAAWMTASDNPFFARALVNRLWAHYFGRGLVEPADALAAANPASHPALLDELARRFAAGGYDLKALHRLILNAHAYQRSSRPKLRASTELDWGKRPHTPALPQTPIPAAQKAMWDEQKPEKVSLFLD